MKPVTLHTSRLILRCAEKGDDEVLFSNYFSNALSSKYLIRKPHHDIAQTQLFLTHWCQMCVFRQYSNAENGNIRTLKTVLFER